MGDRKKGSDLIERHAISFLHLDPKSMHSTGSVVARIVCRIAIHAHDVRDGSPLRYDRYLCLTEPLDAPKATVRVEQMAASLGLTNEFFSQGGDPPRSVAYVRRLDASDADIQDEGILHARGLIRVAAETADAVEAFCKEVQLVARPEAAGSSVAWCGGRPIPETPCTTSPTRTEWCSNRRHESPTRSCSR